MMQQELQFTLTIIGILVIGGVLLHGMWSTRKSGKPSKKASLESKTWDQTFDGEDEDSGHASIYDEFEESVGEVRIVGHRKSKLDENDTSTKKKKIAEPGSAKLLDEFEDDPSLDIHGNSTADAFDFLQTRIDLVEEENKADILEYERTKEQIELSEQQHSKYSMGAQSVSPAQFNEPITEAELGQENEVFDEADATDNDFSSDAFSAPSQAVDENFDVPNFDSPNSQLDDVKPEFSATSMPELSEEHRLTEPAVDLELDDLPFTKVAEVEPEHEVNLFSQAKELDVPLSDAPIINDLELKKSTDIKQSVNDTLKEDEQAIQENSQSLEKDPEMLSDSLGRQEPIFNEIFEQVPTVEQSALRNPTVKDKEEHLLSNELLHSQQESKLESKQEPKPESKQEDKVAAKNSDSVSLEALALDELLGNEPMLESLGIKDEVAGKNKNAAAQEKTTTPNESDQKQSDARLPQTESPAVTAKPPEHTKEKSTVIIPTDELGVGAKTPITPNETNQKPTSAIDEFRSEEGAAITFPSIPSNFKSAVKSNSDISEQKQLPKQDTTSQVKSGTESVGLQRNQKQDTSPVLDTKATTSLPPSNETPKVLVQQSGSNNEQVPESNINKNANNVQMKKMSGDIANSDTPNEANLKPDYSAGQTKQSAQVVNQQNENVADNNLVETSAKSIYGSQESNKEGVKIAKINTSEKETVLGKETAPNKESMPEYENEPPVYSNVVTQPKPEFTKQQLQKEARKTAGDFGTPPAFLLKKNTSEVPNEEQPVTNDTKPKPSENLNDTVNDDKNRTPPITSSNDKKLLDDPEFSLNIQEGPAVNHTQVKEQQKVSTSNIKQASTQVKSSINKEEEKDLSFAEQAKRFVRRKKKTVAEKIRKEPVIKDKAAEDQMRIDFDDTAGKEPTQETPKQVATPQREPELKQEQAPLQSDVLVLNVRAPDDNPIQGAELLPMLLTLGFKFGEHDIFHRHVSTNGKGPILFSLTNMFKPGVFDIDNIETFSTYGISLFMMLPIEGDAQQVFNMMHNASRKLSDAFGCRILDGNRVGLSKRSLQQYVERIRKFERKTTTS